jgi:CRISPR-associated protein Cas2
MAERAINWILAYDITCKKRLVRICKYMKNNGLHVQKSVFMVVATRKAMSDIIDHVRSIIDEKEDDVRVYGCVPMEKADMLGQPYLDGDLMWV